MWYFSWVLGVGFAVLLPVLNAMWGEASDARTQRAEEVNGAARGEQGARPVRLHGLQPRRCC